MIHKVVHPLGSMLPTLQLCCTYKFLFITDPREILLRVKHTIISVGLLTVVTKGAYIANHFGTMSEIRGAQTLGTLSPMPLNCVPW
jgi:hypothetical protein